MVKTLEEFRSAYVRAQQDPAWQRARQRYIDGAGAGASPDENLVARTLAAREMYEIELAAENAA